MGKGTEEVGQLTFGGGERNGAANLGESSPQIVLEPLRHDVFRLALLREDKICELFPLH
jgi:hypothetical protein